MRGADMGSCVAGPLSEDDGWRNQLGCSRVASNEQKLGLQDTTLCLRACERAATRGSKGSFAAARTMSFSPVVHPTLVPTLAKLCGISAIGCYAVFELSLAPMRRYSKARDMRPSTAVFLASCFGSMANALVTSPLALRAFYMMVVNPGQPISLTMSAPEDLVWSCGITAGYFIADCLQMVLYHADYKREMGPQGMALMWGHHCISLVMWPYS
eukprot:3696874-Prymnesium_polylepis.1